jgi:hypothetical protein
MEQMKAGFNRIRHYSAAPTEAACRASLWWPTQARNPEQDNYHPISIWWCLTATANELRES